ncbi:MAG TPA: segregation/condensation protein A [Hydrogenispora sp.]|jgi:segregation and condensation protein A|nr:segregation/condensation protein A [Hydrogenispora sp.]
MRKIKRRTDKQASYQVKLAAFTGPLDLLLHLIERAEIDIYNIPIVEITDQFLAYLQTMELFDLHIAADFLLMAATLMQIKARMLLPRPLVETEEEAAEEEDPRLELVERLLEYKKAKEVATRLQEREAEARRFFPRTGGYFPDLEVAATAEPVGQVTLWDLVQAFSALLESLLPRLELEGMPEEEYSIQEMMDQIMAGLDRVPRIHFSALFSGLTSRKAVVASFLALLELIRMHKVLVQQDMTFGEIVVARWEG